MFVMSCLEAINKLTTAITKDLLTEAKSSLTTKLFLNLLRKRMFKKV